MDKSASNKRKCKTLCLSDKVKIIQEVEKGVRIKKDIAAEYGIPANTLSNILKKKDLIISAANDCEFQPDRKRMKHSSLPDVEKAMVKWTTDLRDANIPLSGTILREKAAYFGAQLGHTEFKGSVGWLNRFKDRNGIVHRVVSGESASVPEEDCEVYRNNILPDLLNDYSPDDIFNADETGLFYKCLPNKTLAFKNEDCHGGKNSKERVTVMVAANMSGTEKLPLLVIGKSKTPHCFRRVNSLPVEYKNNKKAWMTSLLYEEWLKKIDRKFYIQKRNIILFVDNCPAHAKIETLKAVKIFHLPPNTTSKLQPMDQGIIKNLKFYYRKRVVHKIIDAIDRKKENVQINLLDSVTILRKAWNDVTSTTISNCFKKAGFKKSFSTDSDGQEEVFLEIIQPEKWSRLQVQLDCNDVTFEDFVNVDANVIVAERPSDSEIINMIINPTQSEDSSDEEGELNLESQTEERISIAQAEFFLSGLRKFAMQENNIPDQVFSTFDFLDDLCERKIPCTQSKITKYFHCNNKN